MALGRRHSCGRATMWLRSCGSNVARRSSCLQSVTAGNERFLPLLSDILTARADRATVEARAPRSVQTNRTLNVVALGLVMYWGEGSFSIRFWGHFLSNTVSRCITTVSRCITIHPPLRCMYHIVSRMYHYRIILDDGRGFMILCISDNV